MKFTPTHVCIILGVISVLLFLSGFILLIKLHTISTVIVWTLSVLLLQYIAWFNKNNL